MIGDELKEPVSLTGSGPEMSVVPVHSKDGVGACRPNDENPVFTAAGMSGAYQAEPPCLLRGGPGGPHIRKAYLFIDAFDGRRVIFHPAC